MFSGEWDWCWWVWNCNALSLSCCVASGIVSGNTCMKTWFLSSRGSWSSAVRRCCELRQGLTEESVLSWGLGLEDYLAFCPGKRNDGRAPWTDCMGPAAVRPSMGWRVGRAAQILTGSLPWQWREMWKRRVKTKDSGSTVTLHGELMADEQDTFTFTYVNEISKSKNIST